MDDVAALAGLGAFISLAAAGVSFMFWQLSNRQLNRMQALCDMMRHYLDELDKRSDAP